MQSNLWAMKQNGFVDNKLDCTWERFKQYASDFKRRVKDKFIFFLPKTTKDLFISVVFQYLGVSLLRYLQIKLSKELLDMVSRHETKGSSKLPLIDLIRGPLCLIPSYIKF